MKRYIVVNIGCIECGVSTTVSKVFKTRSDAQGYADAQGSWRNGGQSNSRVFEVEV